MHTKIGVITSAKMTGTITVTVHRSVFHPLYRKRYRVSKKFLADTADMKDLGLGDTVEITECRPLSKRKRFKVTNVIKRAPRVSEIQEESALVETMQRKQKSQTTSASSASSASSSAQ